MNLDELRRAIEGITPSELVRFEIRSQQEFAALHEFVAKIPPAVPFSEEAIRAAATGVPVVLNPDREGGVIFGLNETGEVIVSVPVR